MQGLDRYQAAGGRGGPGDAGGAGGVWLQAGREVGPVQAGVRQLPHLRQARRLLCRCHVLGSRPQGRVLHQRNLCLVTVAHTLGIWNRLGLESMCLCGTPTDDGEVTLEPV